MISFEIKWLLGPCFQTVVCDLLVRMGKRIQLSCRVRDKGHAVMTKHASTNVTSNHFSSKTQVPTGLKSHKHVLKGE